MKIDYLSQKFQKLGLKIASVMLLEDGYEIRLKVANIDKDDYHDTEEVFRENIKNLDAIDYKGLVVIEFGICNNACTILLVPKSIDAMEDFIWKYVEKYGIRDKKLSCILSDAYSALENAIEHIPQEYSQAKVEAKCNFDKLSRIIFWFQNQVLKSKLT